jgi:HEAT repeat protein
MTSFTELLALGDLRSDGFANEVVRIVSKNLELQPALAEALASGDPVVRGHAADALEKLARQHPGAIVPFLPSVMAQATADEVPMVHWHLAMVLSHVSIIPGTVRGATRTLTTHLRDPSPFVRSWAITGPVIITLRGPASTKNAVRAISPLTSDSSPAVAKRARTALRALPDAAFRVPKFWLKTQAG